MNAPVTIDAARSISELRDFFAGLCESRADLYADGALTLQEAVDELQAVAELTGLVAAIGQDEVQLIIVGAPPLAPDLAEAYEAEIILRAADKVRSWELSDHRDRHRHTGERPPITQPAPAPRRQPYAPPQSTVDAFLYVARLDDVARLKAWLADHSRDAPILLQLLESKLCTT